MIVINCMTNVTVRSWHMGWVVVMQVLYDLLSPVPGNLDSLQIVDEAGATVVKGLTQVQVSSEEEALALSFEGASRSCLSVTPALSASCPAVCSQDCSAA